MNTYRVEAQAIAELDFTGASFTVTVTAPEGFDQAARRAIRRAVARASEWNAENSEDTPRVTDSAAYRVLAIHAKDAGTYAVDVQAATVQTLDGALFVVHHRCGGLRAGCSPRHPRGGRFRNAENPDAAQRATSEAAYRVLGVGLVV